MKIIPVTVFTGFLGAGKTTIILDLIKQLPKDYKIVILKNEFGNLAVDSKLYQNTNIEVTEMLNGCLCCILVGKLGAALEEIMAKFTPDRIIIETSGSAYPAPIVLEISKIGKDKLKLDGVITVIDAVNFEGYKDTSYTAKLQAQYTDLILINKHEAVAKAELDKVLDDVYALNSTTAKVKTNKGKVSKDLIFGIDSHLYLSIHKQKAALVCKTHHSEEVEIIEMRTSKLFEKKDFDLFLNNLPNWDFYRIKGTLQFENKCYLLNYVFGKWDYTLLKAENIRDEVINSELVFMGKNFGYHLSKIRTKLELTDKELYLI